MPDPSPPSHHLSGETQEAITHIRQLAGPAEIDGSVDFSLMCMGPLVGKSIDFNVILSTRCAFLLFGHCCTCKLQFLHRAH